MRDLLYLFPRRHNDYGSLCSVADLTMEADQTVAVSVWEARETMLGGRMRSTEAVVGDETGNLRVVWFNQPHLAKRFRPGTRLALSGKVTVFRDAPVMQSPEYEPLQSGENMIHTGGLVPVYPLTDGLTPRNLRSLVKAALDGWGNFLEDPLPEEMRRRTGLLPLAQAIRQAHYPQDAESQASARRRLAFDELFVMQMFVFSRRREWRESGGAPPLSRDPGVLDALRSRLPFSLTSAQDRALNEILTDMESERPMSRLLQGDVGSGKTVVALAALLSTVANDRQGAFMAPTEILAQQHFNTICGLVTGGSAPTDGGPLLTFQLPALPRPVSLGLLLGSQPARQKREIQAMMSQGALDMVVGTHALLQQNADLPRLGLAVVDEQHRFGVMQRASLRHKGETPHLLVMSAHAHTALAWPLTLYGDLDLSVLDEQPPGRKPIRTRNVPPDRRRDAYEFVRQQVGGGRQAFVVCPLIEESDVLQTRAATTEFHRLSTEVFPDLTLGLLHGRMPLREKEDVMGRFQRGELDVLVSTPVVEVGIDNRNASVILIDGADRFGLAQLHQFRGRVGRGEHASYCMLMSDYPRPRPRNAWTSWSRCRTASPWPRRTCGPRPGDYFGTRQSGLPDLRMARLSDQDLLSMARQEAAALLREDPALEHPAHHALAQELARFAAASQHGEIS